MSGHSAGAGRLAGSEHGLRLRRLPENGILLTVFGNSHRLACAAFLVLLMLCAAPSARAGTPTADAASAAPNFARLAASAAARRPPPPGIASATRLRAPRSAGPGVRRIRYRYGPINVTPGQNWINIGAITAAQKPAQRGYITRIRPDLVRPDGSVPRSDQVMFHHGVWLNASRSDATRPGLPERFFAAGEEKTILQLPRGFGYPVKPTDRWLMNDMIHNLVPTAMKLYITYDVDFVPARSPVGKRMKPVRPVWMDVENGGSYPVFDVKRGSGRDGRFTYPDDAVRPYGNGPAKNVWTADRAGVIVATSGHLHSGGLWTDLSVERDGAPRPVRLFRSRAKYFEPAGPVSWDVAMTATRPDYRVRVRPGDRLRISATYETKRASWYESMGIMVTYMAARGRGVDPFAPKARVRSTGRPTHGHLHENDRHGGGRAVYPDPRRITAAPFDASTLDISGFRYARGDLAASGGEGALPIVRPGQPLTFRNLEGDTRRRIYHTITACAAPCTGAPGIAYPLANGQVDFDSGQLGYGPPGLTAAVNRDRWSSPDGLADGTYTYFCRIHPFMRGAFRVQR